MARQANRGSFKPGKSGNPRGRAPRIDSVFNPYSGHGTARDRSMYTSFVTPTLSDRESLNMVRGNWIARTIVNSLPEDAFRRGWDLQLDDKDQAESLVAMAEDLGVNEICEEAAKAERMAGGAAIFPVIDGAQGDLGSPLRIDRVHRVLALHVLEARELYPLTWYTDLAHPKFGLPETYTFQPMAGHATTTGIRRIHESRLAIFPGRRVSRQIQSGQREGFGDSVLLPVRKLIADVGLSIGSLAALLADFAKGVLKKQGLDTLLSTDQGRETLELWKDGLDMSTSTIRAVLLGDGDEYSRQSTPITGADAALLLLLQVCAGAAEMPMTRFVGMSPAGLNATGESDTRSWYDTVGRAQSTKYRRPIEWLLKLLMRSSDGPTNGVEPDVWSIAWRPLWTPSEKEQAETRAIQAQTDAVYLDRAVVTPDEVCESRFGGDAWSSDTRVEPEKRSAAMMLPRIVEPGGKQAEPTAAPTPTEAPAPAPAEDVTLNGAQVTSLVEVIRASVAGEIPRESAQAIVELAFKVPAARASALLGPSGFKPTVAEPPASPPRFDASNTEHPLYATWEQMRQRCTNENNKDFADYGGRGIRVCSEWDDFERFIEDMGSRPSNKHTLERINNEDDYKPSNCEWATMVTQNENRR